MDNRTYFIKSTKVNLIIEAIKKLLNLNNCTSCFVNIDLLSKSFYSDHTKQVQKY